jgi:hypothetical protein
MTSSNLFGAWTVGPTRGKAARAPRDPEYALALNELAYGLQATNRFSEAGPLMRRALAIDEKIQGPTIRPSRYVLTVKKWT